MASAHLVDSQPLQSVEHACCPLCKSALPVTGMFYTPDFGLLVRDGYVAKFTWGEAAVIRALFKESQTGFRLDRQRLIDRVYGNSDAPLNANGVVSTWIHSIRPKLFPLGMGVVSESGTVNLVFTPPGYKRK